MDLFVFVYICLLLPYVWSYNIDEENYLRFTGDSGTNFGFSTALLKNDKGVWLLAGAPKANFTHEPNITTPGNVYKCLVDLSTKQQRRCEEISNLRTGETTKTRPQFSNEEDHQLLGANLLVTNQKVVACSSLWKNVKYEFIYKRLFVIGYCYDIQKSNLDAVTRRRFFDLEQGTNLVTSGGFVYGIGLIGFSTASMAQHPDYDFVFGGPGINEGKGGFVLANLNKTGNDTFYNAYKIRDEPSLQNTTLRGAYAGYAVGAGKFGPISSTPPLVIIGMPRFTTLNDGYTGAVIMMSTANNTLRSIKVLAGDQNGSGFGTTLCIADINGDDKDDLLVGAPYFTFGIGKDNLYECGKVYVYYGTGDVDYTRKQPDLLNLVGSKTSKSRFGLAITSVGDINADSFNDIVIGAPYEDELNGAIYIYNGRRSDIHNIYSQRISGKRFQPKLKAFGMHISSSFDVDVNQYGDFAVGAYMSDTVIVLRARPIVNMTATVTITPDVIPLDSSGLRCSLDPSKPCVNIRVCFKFVGIGVSDGILIDFDVKADTLRTVSRKSSRLSLFVNNENHGDHYTKTKFRVLRGGYSCDVIIGRVQTMSREFYSAISDEIRFEAEFRLSNESLPGRVFPILNEQLPKKFEKSAYFQRECVGKCRSNLKLQISVLEPGNNNIVFGRTKEIVLRIKLINTNQPAYATTVVVQISNYTTYLGAQVNEGSRGVTCALAENSTLTDGYDAVICDVLKPLYQHHVVDFRLRINVAMDELLPCDRCYDDVMSVVHVKALADAHGSIEDNPHDNKVSNSFPIQFISKLELNGISKPEQYKLTEGDKDYLEFRHEYFVYNNGPSPLPPTSIFLDIPIKGENTKQFVEQNYISIEPSLKDSNCKLLGVTGGVGNIQSTKNPSPTSPSTLFINTATTTLRSHIIPTAEPQRRRREAAPPEATPPKAAPQEAAPPEQITLQSISNITCGTYHCAKYKCSLKHLDVAEKAEFKILMRVKTSELPFQKNDVLLRYKTKVEVEQPPHRLFYPWNRGLYYMAYIDFFPENISVPTTKINIWIIIGGCLGGLLLIIILGIILWKSGFFKREQPKGFKEWKRETTVRRRRETIRRRQSQRSTTSTQKSSTKSRYEPEEIATITKASDNKI